MNLFASPLRRLAALLLGAAFSTGFAPLSCPYAAFPALAAGLGLMAEEERPRGALLSVFLFAFGAFAPGLSWTLRSMHEFGRLPLPVALLGLLALAAVCALFWGAAAGAAAKLLRPGAPRLFALAGLLTFAEWLRGEGGIDFGWLTPAFATLDTLLAELAPLGGEHLVNLALLVGAAALAALVLHRSARTTLAALAAYAVIGALAAFGGLSTWSEAGPQLTLRIVQADLPVVDGWTRPVSWRRLRDAANLMRESWPAGDAPRLALTPEGIITTDILKLPKTAQAALEDFIAAADAPVLLSAFRHDEEGEWRNSALLAADGKVAVTDKRKLVPFGEFVPAGFRWFVDAMNIPLADQARGGFGQENPIVAPGIRAGVLICYENLDGEVLRSLWTDPKAAPNLLLVTANLGWFDPRIIGQHLDMTRLLAKASARPAASVSMNGSSALVDERGRIVAQAPESGAAVLTLAAQTRTGGATPFLQFGNLPALLLALFLVLGGALAGRLGRGAER